MQLWSSVVAAAALVASALPATSAQTAYRYRTYGEIVDTLYALEAKYPSFVELYSAQSKYGIPLRSELACVRGGVSAPCQHYVIEITDESTLPDAQRPEVFISGALHGDERVGPQTAIALAEFLLDHAGRADGNPWIKRLVQTRRVVIMPTTNAYGYEKNVRAENGYDPNRDFNYNKGSTCFQTIVARAVNEVWRDHLFQLSITFHGGTRSISYEWGSTNHVRSSGGSQRSPDDRGQWYMAKGMSRYGGKFQEDSTYYPDGPMNDIVYAVDGGMEDWAYAASWENSYTTPRPIGVCNPTTYGGYAAAKSSYNSATHRSFNILIETSTAKQPTAASLGTNATLSAALLADYLPSSTTLGHVARNLRISLMYIDLVQPYVAWKIAPTTATAGTATSLQWEVAGGITVGKTQLQISRSADMSSPTLTTAQAGVTRWYHPDMATSTSTNKGLFTQSYTFPSAGTYYVQAVATLDQDWTTQGTGATIPVPNVKPQTHVVNARTNTAWSYSNNGRTVTGKTEWASSVTRVVVT
uniref:Peptidase M14 domain-containing protein n=1 Tax=Globisporangium ultimum (strain ATCC 200006 / CBS 805.95 / DAOM BR144) TaxID=431595 RepID=K3WZB5_GLOUD